MRFNVQRNLDEKKRGEGCATSERASGSPVRRRVEFGGGLNKARPPVGTTATFGITPTPHEPKKARPERPKNLAEKARKLPRLGLEIEFENNRTHHGEIGTKGKSLI